MKNSKIKICKSQEVYIKIKISNSKIKIKLKAKISKCQSARTKNNVYKAMCRCKRKKA
jgi:hypothetical protein